MSDSTNPKTVPADKVAKPTDQEVMVVAKAMDVDNTLDWKSKDHDKTVAISNAKADALHMILGFRAVTGMAGFVSADNAEVAKAKANADAKVAADKAAAAKVAPAAPIPPAPAFIPTPAPTVVQPTAS